MSVHVRRQALRPLNHAALDAELEELFAFEKLDIDVEALLTRCEKEGQSFQRLSVNRIHP